MNARAFLLVLVPVLTLAACATSPSRAPAPTGESAAEAGSVAELFRGHVNAFREKVLGERMHAPVGLAQFYRARDHREAWSEELAIELSNEIHLKAREGLDPGDFHAKAISTVLEDLKRRRSLGLEIPRRTLAQLDILCTDAFLALASQLQTGRVGLKALEELPARDDVEAPAVALVRALASQKVAGVLEDRTPRSEEYQGLVKALVLYRAFAAGRAWPLVPPGAKIEPGGRDARVPILRKRLAEEGYFPRHGQSAASSKSWLYDEETVEALKAFQSAHGLLPSGRLDKSTSAELNVSPRRRQRQIEANLERWRWLPRDLGSRFVEVNIPAFELRAVNRLAGASGGPTVATMPVVVGNLYRQTPVFWSHLSSLVLNPSWFVPRTILIQDILPKARKNADFLSENGFHASRPLKGGRTREIELSEIDWDSIEGADDVDFSLREESAPANPLGRVKFVFANPYSIFLHDFPKHDVFRKNSRALSSGCIRLSKPMDLLSFVLAGEPEWDEARIAGLVADLDSAGKDEAVNLSTPVPIYLLYQTAWLEPAPDGESRVQFRRDIYGQDELLEEQL